MLAKVSPLFDHTKLEERVSKKLGEPVSLWFLVYLSSIDFHVGLDWSQPI